MGNMAGYIKNKIKTYLLKDRELANSLDYVYEMLCREFARISSMDVGSGSGNAGFIRPATIFSIIQLSNIRLY